MCLCAPFGRDDKGSISHLYLFRFFFSTLFFLPLLAAEMIVIRREGGEWGGGVKRKRFEWKYACKHLIVLKTSGYRLFFFHCWLDLVSKPLRNLNNVSTRHSALWLVDPFFYFFFLSWTVDPPTWRSRPSSPLSSSNGPRLQCLLCLITGEKVWGTEGPRWTVSVSHLLQGQQQSQMEIRCQKKWKDPQIAKCIHLWKIM